MSRSYRRTPVFGNSLARSDKPGRTTDHRRYRHYYKDRIRHEDYDDIEDPVQRLKAIVECMKDISNWDKSTKHNKLMQAQIIADYNKKHFFSESFMSIITSELKQNLKPAISKILELNRSESFLSLRKYTMDYPLPWAVINQLEGENSAEIVKRALSYNK